MVYFQQNEQNDGNAICGPTDESLVPARVNGENPSLGPRRPAGSSSNITYSIRFDSIGKDGQLDPFMVVVPR